MFYTLTKPGIVWSNTLAAIAGYLFASAWELDFGVLFGLATGIMLVIGCACTLNNILDRSIDAKMKRTSKRALVNGEITVRQALLFAAVVGTGGFALLLTLVSWLVFWLGVFALFAYVVLYGWAKRATLHGTLVGTISGSLPPVAGYAAVTGQLDVTALLLFVLWATWQMAHFYSIAIFRRNDYATAGIPVSPVVVGVQKTRQAIVGYILLFAIASALLGLFGNAGSVFVIVTAPLAVWWLWGAFEPAKSEDAWGRRMFGASLIVLLTLMAILSVSSVLA